jgi:hypothetical protein
MTVRKNFVLRDIFCDYFITRFPLHLSFIFFSLFRSQIKWESWFWTDSVAFPPRAATPTRPLLFRGAATASVAIQQVSPVKTESVAFSAVLSRERRLT